MQQQLELHISTFPSFTLLSFCMISQSHRQEVLHHGFSIGGRLRISTLSNCFPSTSSKNSTTRVVWQVSILCIFLIVYPKANKCNQYDYASSQAGNLRTHLKTHIGEKANKCNQCDYAFSQAGHLRTHLKTHSTAVEKGQTMQAMKWIFASIQAGYLKTHLKTHSEEKSNKCNSASLLI